MLLHVLNAQPYKQETLEMNGPSTATLSSHSLDTQHSIKQPGEAPTKAILDLITGQRHIMAAAAQAAAPGRHPT
jgi:hypothetical protein